MPGKYMKLKSKILLLPFLFPLPALTQAPVFSRSFDEGNAQGVRNNAVMFDGYFTEQTVPCTSIPTSLNFTIEAWIAPQEYASNVAAVADKENDFTSGYLFGINQYGQLVASAAIHDKWMSLVSTESVPLLKWTHVAMTVESGNQIKLYINGKVSGEMKMTAPISFCDSCCLSIGKTQTATAATNTERASSIDIKTHNRFYGLMDELHFYQNSLTEKAIAQKFSSATPVNAQPLHFNQMPSGPEGFSAFGAFYTRLKYSPGWDSLWRGSDYPDIVVRFANSPVRYVFWRGTGYIPAIVNEKNQWMSDQSLEHYGTGECYEAMGDKQTRYSHVRLIENTAARVVIHWRYTLAGIHHQLLHMDENGWGDWVDEYWTIYPDGIAARKQVLWSKAYETDKGVMQWQETIFFNQPGTRPQDNVDMKAITFMDMDGIKASYSWQNGPPKKFDLPARKPIELVNLKAKYKPFSVFDATRTCKPFSFGMNKAYTTIPNWNHWPVQQTASDGRTAVAPDKPSHSSLTDTNGSMQVTEKKGEGEYWACSLRGMTTAPIDSLMTLTRSWNSSPQITPSTNIIAAAFNKYERSYVVKAADPCSKQLAFSINASAASPLFNLPVVITGWNAHAIVININNKKIKEGRDYQAAFIPGLEESKWVVFINTKSIAKMNVVLYSK